MYIHNDQNYPKVSEIHFILDGHQTLSKPSAPGIGFEISQAGLLVILPVLSCSTRTESKLEVVSISLYSVNKREKGYRQIFQSSFPSTVNKLFRTVSGTCRVTTQGRTMKRTATTLVNLQAHHLPTTYGWQHRLVGREKANREISKDKH